MRTLPLLTLSLSVTTGCSSKPDTVASPWFFEHRGTWADVAAGGDFACAIDDGDRGISCWGPADSPAVTDAPTDTGWADIVAGTGFACARKYDGLPVCWGDDSDGQATPDQAMAVALSAGDRHACSVLADGIANCWGDGSTGATLVPNDRFTMVAAGAGFSCGLGSGEGLRCWGDESGDTGGPPAGGPAVAPALAADAVFAGFGFACALHNDAATCWGDTSPWSDPFAAGDWAMLDLGAGEICGLHTDGSAECAGLTAAGGSLEGGFIDVAAGGGGGCALADDGKLSCWFLDGAWLPAATPPTD